jgi:hypothetical protein
MCFSQVHFVRILRESQNPLGLMKSSGSSPTVLLTILASPPSDPCRRFCFHMRKDFVRWVCQTLFTWRRPTLSINNKNSPKNRVQEFMASDWKHKSITVVVRSKSWTVFTRSNACIVGSNPTRSMGVCVRLFCVCAVLCANSGLATNWSPVKESYWLCKRSRNWKSGQGPTKGCRAIDVWMIDR